jgi:hypothetical protein
VQTRNQIAYPMEAVTCRIARIEFRAKVMAIQAATVGILIEKSKFEPEVALGVAEAIDLAMTQAQFVTVPILDARLHEIRTELRVLAEKVDAKLDASVYKTDMQRFSAEFNAKFDTKLTGLEARFDTRLAGLEAKLDKKFAEMEAKFDTKLAALDAKIDTKLAELEAKLVRWVFLVMLGNVALSLAANALMNAFKSL